MLGPVKSRNRKLENLKSIWTVTSVNQELTAEPVRQIVGSMFVAVSERSSVIAGAAALMLMTAIASHTAIQIQAAPPVPSQTTANLEHVVIAVRDLAVATTSYERLGFAVTPGGSHPSGGTTGNGIFFSNGTYLELLTFYDREKAADLAEFLEEREGPRSIALEVSSAVVIRDALHAAGIEGTEPKKGKWESSSPVTKEWLTIEPKPALPDLGARRNIQLAQPA